MENSSHKDLAVFDFNEDDEAVESNSGKLVNKFISRLDPKDEDALSNSTVLKARDNTHGSYAIAIPERNRVSTEETPVLDKILASSTSYDECKHICQDKFVPGDLVREDPLVMRPSGIIVPSVVNKQFPELPSNEKPADVISDDEESWTPISRSSSIPASDLAENEDYLGHPASDNCCTSFGDMENSDMAVNVSTDYVLYANTLCAETQITFFSDCIKIESSYASGNEESFISEWAVDDVINIDCQWSESVETAWVKIRLRPTAANKAEKVYDASDIVKLIFTVTDIRWLEREQKIMSLAARYRDIWNVLPDDELAMEDNVMGPNMVFSKFCFTEIAQPFEDFIYPKGDPDAVSICNRDIELLQPDTFINDTIIDFYIKYLKNKVQSDEKHRFHFFNSFFFRKLADLDKDPKSGSEGRAAFQRVRKWTRKVNIFEKDYIFIPVNFNLHWSLLIVCHPGEVAVLQDDEMNESPKVPCILHMDSIKGSHNGLKNLVQSYLWEEWKERHPESPEDNSSKFLNLRFVHLELPQQENSFDCGLFLLHYVELFLEEAQVNFNPFKITKFSSYLNVDWFSPAEASLKRSHIRKLIYELLNDPSQKVTPVICSNGHLSSEFPENGTEQEPAVEFLSVQHSPAQTVCDDSACSIAGRGIDIKLMTSSPPGAVQCDKGAGLVMQKLLEPGEIALSSPGRRDHPFQQIAPFQKFKCTMSPIEEDADIAQRCISTNLDEDGCQPATGSATTQTGSASYSSKDIEVNETSLSPDVEKEEEKDEDGALSSDSLTRNHAVSDQKEEAEKPGSVLLENCGYVADSPALGSRETLETCIVKDSQEVDSNEAVSGEPQDSEEIKSTEGEGGDTRDSQEIDTTEPEGEACHGPFPSCQESLSSLSSQDVGLADNENSRHEDDVRLRQVGSVTRLEQLSYKRRKVRHHE